MTKNDLHNLIDIVDKLRKEEKDLCDRHMALNPDDIERIRICDHITEGINRVWFEIREQYRNVWEGDDE